MLTISDLSRHYSCPPEHPKSFLVSGLVWSSFCSRDRRCFPCKFISVKAVLLRTKTTKRIAGNEEYYLFDIDIIDKKDVHTWGNSFCHEYAILQVGTCSLVCRSFGVRYLLNRERSLHCNIASRQFNSQTRSGIGRSGIKKDREKDWQTDSEEESKKERQRDGERQIHREIYW